MQQRKTERQMRQRQAEQQMRQRKTERERLNSWVYRKQTPEKPVEQDDPLIEQALLIMEAQEAKANPKQPIEAPPQAASAPALGRLSVREYVRRGVWQRA